MWYSLFIVFLLQLTHKILKSTLYSSKSRYKTLEEVNMFKCRVTINIPRYNSIPLARHNSIRFHRILSDNFTYAKQNLHVLLRSLKCFPAVQWTTIRHIVRMSGQVKQKSQAIIDIQTFLQPTNTQNRSFSIEIYLL